MDAPLSHPARRDRPTDRTHCGLHTLSVVASGRRFGVAGRAVLIAAKARRQWVNDSGFETPLHSHIELAVLDRRPAAPRKSGLFSRSASVWLEKVALYWNGEDTSSTLGHGGSDQPQASLRLACRGRSWENEALGIRPRDATANLLTVDSVDHGIRQQYRRLPKGHQSFAPSHQKAFSQTARFRLRAITDSQKAPAKINFSSPLSQWCKRKEDMKKSSKTEVSFDQEHNDSPLFGSVSDAPD